MYSYLEYPEYGSHRIVRRFSELGESVLFKNPQDGHKENPHFQGKARKLMIEENVSGKIMREKRYVRRRRKRSTNSSKCQRSNQDKFIIQVQINKQIKRKKVEVNR